MSSKTKSILDTASMNIPFCVYSLLLPFVKFLFEIINTNFSFSNNCQYLIYIFFAICSIFLCIKEGFNQNALNYITLFFDICISVSGLMTKSYWFFIMIDMGGFILVVIHFIVWCILLSRLIRWYRKELYY